MNPGTRRRARTKNKTLKRGGAALSANTFTHYGISRYFAHSMILRDYFVPLTSGGCNGKAVEIYFVNKGYNGFILQFKCVDIKAIKILFNRNNPLTDRVEWERLCRDKLTTEYGNIRTFSHSKYIIKSYGYFIFDGREFKCTGLKPYDKDYAAPYSIDNAAYKVEPLNARRGTPNILEPFGGIVLEYVNHSLNKIRQHLQSIKKENPKFYIDNIPQCVFTIIELFYQYILGITDINNEGYVHTDIKVDNLMFEKNDHGYTAKIVDLANIKKINSEWDLTSNSKVMPLQKQYHKGAIQRLIMLKSKGADLRSIEALKQNYLQRYDLYSLCVTFNYILSDLKPDLFNFAEAIAEENKRADGPRESKKVRLNLFKTAFELFDREITRIKSIPSEATDLYTLETIHPNTTFSSIILNECILKMFPRYGH
jgi:hypothetical protein